MPITHETEQYECTICKKQAEGRFYGGYALCPPEWWSDGLAWFCSLACVQADIASAPDE